MHPFLPPNLAQLRMADCEAHAAAENRARAALDETVASRRFRRALRWRRQGRHQRGGDGIAPAWPEAEAARPA